MNQQRALRLDDYVAFLRRRWWIILLPAVLGAAIGYGITPFIKPQYTSTTMVLVEQPRVPTSLVTPVVTEELNQRLGTMKEQILSRTRLQPIVEKFDFFASSSSMESRIEQLRSAILVTAVRADFGGGRRGGGGGVPGFTIGVTHSDPRVAQQVCSEITSMFIAENLRHREQRAQGTTDFLSKQLEESKRRLDEHDSALASFKRRYLGQLPGSEQSNLRMLGVFSSQLEAVTQALNRAQQDKNYLATLIQQRLDALESRAAAGGGLVTPQALETQLAAKQSDLVALEGRYTEDHPDVIKARRDIEQLEKRLGAVTDATASADVERRPLTTEPQDVRQLRVQLHQVNQAIADRTAQQQRLQRDLKAVESRVQLSPMVEEEYKQLTRDYETALNFYNDLLAKRTQSEMATDLERQQQGEQFRVMDPANLPSSPSYPDPVIFSGGGLAAGFVLGLGVAVLLDFRARAIHTDLDIEFYLGIPTLAMITDLGGGQQHKKKKRLFSDWRGNGSHGTAREVEEYRETVGKS